MPKTLWIITFIITYDIHGEKGIWYKPDRTQTLIQIVDWNHT